jgi:hypothetical protein
MFLFFLLKFQNNKLNFEIKMRFHHLRILFGETKYTDIKRKNFKKEVSD